MSTTTRSSFKRIIQWLAGSIATSIAIIVPSETLFTNYNYLNAMTQNEARYIAEDMSRFVFKHPDTWVYQDLRFNEIIGKYTDAKIQKPTLILGVDEVIYETDINLKTPIITVQEFIYNASEKVAIIQVQVSARPLLIKTFFTALFALALGSAVYLILYFLPMRALSAALEKLDEAQNLLHKEMLGKEKALQESHELGQKLHDMAMHDSLTGLPNRSMYHDRLSQSLSFAERQNSLIAVVMIDLNRFKEVNDTLGHHVGDALLIVIAHRLKDTLRKSDTIARLGGDEFSLVLHIKQHIDAINLCNKISQIIKTPVNLSEQKLQLSTSASCGIAYYPDDAIDSDHLLQKADIAMYAAKKISTNIAVYNEKLDTNTPEKLRLASQMIDGIHNNEFFLVYQPKIDLKTLKIQGVEALLRWQHPEDGLISPVVFIPLAEGSEIIHPLTEWVINTALEQLYIWKKSGLKLQMSVNISGKNLRDKNFYTNFTAAVKKWEINPEEIILEITESAMIDDPENALIILNQISDQGISLSIDDFGTGHASLIQLKTFPFNELKVDRSFIKDMISDSHDAAIVRSAIALAKSLDMKTVAEGIEDERMIDLLREMNCDVAQGFYFSKPLVNEELLNWINNN